MIRRLPYRFALGALLLIWASAVLGHSADQSYIFLDVYDDRIDGRLEIRIPDLNKAMGTSFPEDDTATMAEIEPYLDDIRRYMSERVSLAVDGGPAGIPWTDHGFTTDFAQFLALGFTFDGLAEPAKEIDIEFGVLFDTHPDHRNMVVIQNNWKTSTFDQEGNVVLSFSPGNTKQKLDLTDSSVWRGFAGMVALGIHHIFEGIDHILFLLALLLPAVVYRRDGAWQPVTGFGQALIYVIKVVTVFTIAHTITLSLAALGAVSLSSRLVESIIAFSIAVAALNIIVPIFRDRIWLVVFAFGLFHGFGFASVLGEYGIPSNYIVHSLLGFNIGVEIGQVAIVCALFPILYLLRGLKLYTSVILRAGAAVLIAISMYWFTERAFLVDLPAGAIVNSVIGAFQ